MFDRIKKGDIINYDIELRNGKLKNESALVLDKNDKMIKLDRLGKKWYCTKSYFMQLQNACIIKSD